MYGAKGILVCGYPADDHEPLAYALKQIGLGDRPIIFVTHTDSSKAMKELLSSADRSGIGQPSDMPKAIIMSGFTQEEVHLLMGAYRQAGLPSQLWATLTPVSENWTLGRLVKELSTEAESFKAQGKGKQADLSDP